jgi:hypothetical protein
MNFITALWAVAPWWLRELEVMVSVYSISER